MPDRVLRRTYDEPMPTSSAVGDDDDRAWLSAELRAKLMGSISTRSLAASLRPSVRLPHAIIEQLNDSAGRVAQVQVANLLDSQSFKTSLAASIRPVEAQALDTRELVEPMLTQINARQQQWARQLSVPVLNSGQLKASSAVTLASPQLAASLQRINGIIGVRLEFPDANGIDRLAELIASGEIDKSTLEAAEGGVSPDADLVDAIDEIADVLTSQRPWLSVKECRRIVMLWVWLMWTACLVGIALYAPPVVGAVAGAGLVGSNDVAKKAGETFDKHFPPEK